MRSWKAWVAGALALVGLAAAPDLAQARTSTVPDLLPLTNSVAAVETEAHAAPTCQWGYGHRGWRYRHGYYGHRGWRHRHYGWRRPYGWRRHGYYRRRYY